MAIKTVSQTWQDAYDNFIWTGPPSLRDTIGNLQYECRDAAAADTEEQELAVNADERQGDRYVSTEDEENDVGVGEDHDQRSDLTEVDLQALIAQKQSTKEAGHGRAAVSIARSVGMFSDGDGDASEYATGARKFRSDDVGKLKGWKVAMEKQNTRSESFEEDVEQGEEGGVSSISPLMTDTPDEGGATLVSSNHPPNATNGCDVFDLKEDQSRAYSMITNHLHAELQGQKPLQLLMQTRGEGGTGKTKVIQMVTATFEDLGASGRLLKGAYTGIAARGTGGATLHSLCGVPVRGKQPSPAAINKLALVW